MNILFIGYWNLQDPLTIATIFPHLKILSSFSNINKLIFTNTQRINLEAEPVKELLSTGAIYEPLYSKNLPLNQINKIYDFIYFPDQIIKLIEKHKIDKVIARGAPAGVLAYLVWKRIEIPFYVESYEPHADYMLESEVWSKWDLRYIFQKKWEKKINEYAAGLMPVTKNYKEKLIDEGIPSSKIEIVPCSVDMEKFKFNSTHRQEIRNKLGFSDTDIVGIYAGKFGGLYYYEEAFDIFLSSRKFFGEKFKLIILTSNNIAECKKKLIEKGFLRDDFYINKVEHFIVKKYLSSSDFAYALYKPGISKKYLSPIKNGEYWANGLPILLTEGVGDECDIIEQEECGALFNLYEIKSLAEAFEKISKIIEQPDKKKIIPLIAGKYRSILCAEKAYKYFLK